MHWVAHLLRHVIGSGVSPRRRVRLWVVSLEGRAVPSVSPLPEELLLTPTDPVQTVSTAGNQPPSDGAPVTTALPEEQFLYAASAGDNNPGALASNESSPIPPGMQPPYPQVSGRVWRDLNGNGLQDAREPGIPAVTLQLYQADKLVGTTVTDGLGNYAFNRWSVTNGTADTADDGFSGGKSYEIRVAGSQAALTALRPTASNVGTDDQRDSDAVRTAAGATLAFTMGFGAYYPNHDFGFAPAASLRGVVWSDANNNGIRDAGEAGVAGVTVRLLDETGTTVPGTTTTGADGSYQFSGLLPGRYVVEVARENFAAGSALFGGVSSTGAPGRATGPYEADSIPTPVGKKAPAYDSGMTVAGGAVRCAAVTLSAGTDETRSAAFGFFRAGTVTGRVFVDMNGNGRLDAADTAGVPNVRVTASGPAGVFETPTDATGGYSFTNLPAGTYWVAQALPGQYRSSTPTYMTATVGPDAPATVHFGASRVADLGVRLSARAAGAGVGGIVTLTYRVRNQGTLDATGVTLTTPLPRALKIESVTQTAGTYDPASQRLTIPTLAAGSEAVVTIRARVTRAATYRLTAMVLGLEAEAQSGDNRARAAFQVDPVNLRSIGRTSALLSSAFSRPRR